MHIITSVIKLFNKEQSNRFQILIFLSFIAMILETLTLASLFPLILSITDIDRSNQIIEILNLSFTKKIDPIIFFLILPLIFTLKIIFMIYYSHLKFRFIENVKVYQSNNLFSYYLNKEYIFHIQNSSSQLIRNLNEAQSLGVVIRHIMEIILETLVLLGIVIFLFYLNFSITFYSIIVFGFLGIIFKKFILERAKIWGKERQKFSGLKLLMLQQGFGALKDIFVSNKQEFFVKAYADKNKNESIYNYKQNLLGVIPKHFFEWVSLILVIVFLLARYSQNDNMITIIPELATFIFGAYRIIPSIVKITQSYQGLKYWGPIVVPYLNKDQNDNRFSKTQNKIFLNQNLNIGNDYKIKIKNLTYAYKKNAETVLENLNFTINSKTMIGIYGSSGSGKTTFVNLLIGLLQTNHGQILINDININDNLKDWLQIISYVPQNVYILDDTLSSNIAFGVEKKEYDISRIDESVKKASLNNFINSLNCGLESKCGELGEQLSGGQRQRLAIARAYYNNSKILIFDEFTNFLDKKNTENIIKEVKKMQNTTRIIISHDFNVLNYCDHIYELKNKKLEKINK